MKTLALIGVLGSAAALAACQPYAQPGPAAAAQAYATPASAVARSCFRSHDIQNHTLADDHTVYIKVNYRDVYRVETSGGCFSGATSSDPLLMRSPPGSTYICKPIDMDLGVIKGGFTQHCIVSAIVPMSPAQVAALPKKLQP